MRVNEIFRSIQGEGRYMGCSALFVRFQGCSLHCPWCDSAGTWDSNAGTEYTVQRLKDTILNAKRANDIVVFTGGEPTEQVGLYTLVQELRYERVQCHLETNGTEDIPPNYFHWVVCSPKPGNAYHIPNGVDELKYVIKAGDNLTHIINPAIRDKYAQRIWLQPMANGNDIVVENVRYCHEQVMKDGRMRLGFQFHKYLGVR